MEASALFQPRHPAAPDCMSFVGRSSDCVHSLLVHLELLPLLQGLRNGRLSLPSPSLPTSTGRIHGSTISYVNSHLTDRVEM